MADQRGNSLDLGRVVNRKRRLTLSGDLRDKHLYVCGATGSGKSKFLGHLIRQDIEANRRTKHGLLLIDPHGTLYDSIMAWLAYKGLERPVIPIDLRRDDWIVSYNVLRRRKTANPAVVIASIIDAMAHIWGDSDTDRTPLFARWAGNLLHALYENNLTLAEAMHLLSDQVELRQALTGNLTDQLARRDWRLADRMKPREFEDQVGSTVNRLNRFIRNENLRTIFGIPEVSLDLGQAIDEGAIILVSLAREGARVSGEDANLFATLLLNDLWTAAQERGKRTGVKPFHVYLDEFQKFVTPTIAENLDQPRGFGLHLTLAHQYPNQLLNAGPHGKRIYDSVMEDARSKVVFSLSHEDNLKPMALALFRGVMNPDEVKHELWSTKVMAYREEYRRAYSRGTTSSGRGTNHSSSTYGSGSGSSTTYGEDGNVLTSSWDSHFASADGYTDSWSESETESVTEAPMLIPVLGKELSHVQFRSLEEQLFRAMAVLFDQEQRQCVAKLQGMKAPVSLFTPYVPDTPIGRERVERYVEGLLERLPYAVRSGEAMERVKRRERELPDRMLERLKATAYDHEPQTAKRIIAPRKTTPGFQRRE